MIYLEIKDTPKNITSTNKYIGVDYESIGLYKSPDNEIEVIQVYISSNVKVVSSINIYVNMLNTLNFEPDDKRYTVNNIDNDTVLKMLAVTLKPELAFK